MEERPAGGLGDLSAVTAGELLEPDLTRDAQLVGANGRLPSDERPEIDACQLLSAALAERRMRDVPARATDARKSTVARQSAHLATPSRPTSAGIAPSLALTQAAAR